MSWQDDFFSQVAAADQQRTQSRADGLPALHRLSVVARNDSGQASTVGLFLLGLYNGHAYPFNLSRLRGLDLDLYRDCLAVLQMDYQPACEIHEYIDGGEALFADLRDRFRHTSSAQGDAP